MDILEGFDNYKESGHIDPEFIALCGDKGQGKSTLLRVLADYRYQQVVEARKQDKAKGVRANRRVLIHNPNNSRAFEGIPEISVNQIRYGIFDPITKRASPWTEGIRQIKTNSLDPKSNEEIITVIFEKMRNSIIILDEANMWVPKSNKIKPWELSLFSQHRNHCNTIYAMFHNLMDIHRHLRQHIFQYVLFKTPDRFNSAQQLIQLNFPNPEELYRKWVEVEQTAIHPNKRIQKFVVVKKDFSSRVSKPKSKNKSKRK